MGLDAVELVLYVEEAFDIRIADEEAGRVGTLGELQALVVAKLREHGERRCTSSICFFRLRRALSDVFGVGRSSVRRATTLAGLVPTEDRRQAWGRLQESLGLRLPESCGPAGWSARSASSVSPLAALLPTSRTSGHRTSARRGSRSGHRCLHRPGASNGTARGRRPTLLRVGGGRVAAAHPAQQGDPPLACAAS